jgi:hypothetical protein
MSILDPTGHVDNERAAVAMTERPGYWDADLAADGRQLSQFETDTLICAELWFSRPLAEICGDGSDELRAILGEPCFIALVMGSERRPYQVPARVQRGGIHSDPLIRLLAFRAWAWRDIDWVRTPTQAAPGSRPGTGVRTRP